MPVAPRLGLFPTQGCWVASWGAVQSGKLGANWWKFCVGAQVDGSAPRSRNRRFCQQKEPRCFSIYTGKLAECRLALWNCTFAMVRTPSLQSCRHKIYAVKQEVWVLKWFKSLCSDSRILKGSSCLLCFWVLISMRELNHYIKTSKH